MDMEEHILSQQEALQFQELYNKIYDKAGQIADIAYPNNEGYDIEIYHNSSQPYLCDVTVCTELANYPYSEDIEECFAIPTIWFSWPIEKVRRTIELESYMAKKLEEKRLQEQKRKLALASDNINEHST